MNAFLKPLISVFRAVIRFSLYTFPFSFFIHFSLFQWLRDLFGHLILSYVSLSSIAALFCLARCFRLQSATSSGSLRLLVFSKAWTFALPRCPPLVSNTYSIFDFFPIQQFVIPLCPASWKMHTKSCGAWFRKEKRSKGTPISVIVSGESVAVRSCGRLPVGTLHAKVGIAVRVDVVQLR